ncbi:MAG: hypothetical protein V1899_07590 [Planctomycetota bacterium]
MVCGHLEEVREEKVLEKEEQTEGQRPFHYSVSAMTPWWIVSVPWHVFVIAFVGLISMSKLSLGAEASNVIVPPYNAVDEALCWLAKHQEKDGHWDSVKYNGKKIDTANTGLALLAFLGVGHTEKVGEYKDHVRRAVAWLKSKQATNGLIFDNTDEDINRGIGYPGVIATLALTEATGMANIADTRDAAQKAVNYYCDVHQEGVESDKVSGGYTEKLLSDISMTGWFVMALKSAKVAGLQVNPASFESALKFLIKVEIKNAESSAYGPASRYCHKSGDTPNPRCGAIGSLIRQFLGERKENLQSSVELFIKDGGVPAWGANGENVDFYYWYFGKRCVCQQSGDVRKRWNDGMNKALTENQCKQGDDKGSWNPVGEYSLDWGRVGQTALGVLCLNKCCRSFRLQPYK